MAVALLDTIKRDKSGRDLEPIRGVMPNVMTGVRNGGGCFKDDLTGVNALLSDQRKSFPSTSALVLKRPISAGTSLRPCDQALPRAPVPNGDKT